MVLSYEGEFAWYSIVSDEDLSSEPKDSGRLPGVVLMDALSIQESHQRLHRRAELLSEAYAELRQNPDPWLEAQSGIGLVDGKLLRILDKAFPLSVQILVEENSGSMLLGRDARIAQPAYEGLRTDYLAMANRRFLAHGLTEIPNPPNNRQAVRIQFKVG